jgi:hypothetical protein
MKTPNFAQCRLPLRPDHCRSNNFGCPHRDCHRRRSTVDVLFHRFEVLGSHFLVQKTAREFPIPPSIVYKWHHKWTLDEKWRPVNYEIHGRKRIRLHCIHVFALQGFVRSNDTSRLALSLTSGRRKFSRRLLETSKDIKMEHWRVLIQKR